MRFSKEWTRPSRITAIICVACFAGLLLFAARADAGERKFFVMLATSPKQYDGCDNNQPEEGLINSQLVHAQYFDLIDPGVGSFAEYWEEISYGDITITGDTTDWLILPWPIEPPPPVPACPPSGGMEDRLSPETFTDLNGNGTYQYGVAEGFSTAYASVITDPNGDPNGVDDGPFMPDPGSSHVSEGGLNAGQDVWRPGERYLDIDGDNKWDRLDEANNWRDGDEDGKPDLAGPWIDLNEDNVPDGGPDCLYLADSDNDGNPDCCPDGPGTPGCEPFYIHPDGDPPHNEDACPATQWSGLGDGEYIDCNGNLIPDACDIDCESVECAETGWDIGLGCGGSRDELPFTEEDDVCGPQEDGDDIPDECQFVNPNEDCRDPAIECDPDDQDPTACCIIVPPAELLPQCVPLEREPVDRCEYTDSNASNVLDVVEPYENFLRRWDPCYFDPDVSSTNQNTTRAHWIKVYDPGSGSELSCDSPETSFAYAADTVFQPEEIPDPDNPGQMMPNPLYVKSYIENNYPGPAAEVVAMAQSRDIFGQHDPDGLATACVCMTPYDLDGDGPLPESTDCFDLDLNDDGTIDDPDEMGLCWAGIHANFEPSDTWTDADLEEVGPVKMRAAPGGGGQATFVTATPEPAQAGSPLSPLGERAWFPQAWEDRYFGEILALAYGVGVIEIPPDPTNPHAPFILPESPAPVWPAGWDPNQPGGPGMPPGVKPNTMRFEPWTPDADLDDGGDEFAIRRFFKANFGGTTLVNGRRMGQGIGWFGQDNAFLIFETGLTGPASFEENMDSPIMPEEADGMDNPVFFDGWVEHDDLPSSKYHRAGDERLGEVTSPWVFTQNFGADDLPAIWGQDLGSHELGSTGPGGGDQITPAAGPLAVSIYGASGRDAGNLLILEYLTWRTDGTSPSYGLAWEETFGTSHPYAGPGTGMSPNELIGFRDYNLDGMIDQGETRVPGSENYVADGYQGTPNNGSGTEYPWNRQRLIEDCVEFLDDIVDFDDFVDTVTLDRLHCDGGTRGEPLPLWYVDFDYDNFIAANGVVSGIILLPADAHTDVGQAFIGASPLIYPVHNEDNDDPEDMFPKDPSKTEKISWNLVFHDLAISMGDVTRFDAGSTDFMARYSAHEYLHSWEGFPDLYDYDIYGNPGPLINTPVGQWDIMAGSERVPLNMVHSIPILKEKPCTEWIDPVDLTTVLTPGVVTTLTLPPAEFVRDNSYFFVENEARLGERHYLWSAGGFTTAWGPSFDTPGFPGFNAPNLITDGLPGEGLLISHTDVGSNPDGLPPGNEGGGTRFTYKIIQADGLEDLEGGVAPYGEPGDPFPGSTNNTTFGFNTVPPARWYTQEAWTGITISDVRLDGEGSAAIDISWRPTNIPSIEITQPPGGTSVPALPDVIYQVRAEATDVYGGTLIKFYYTADPEDVSIGADGNNYIGSMFKTTPGTHSISVDWNIANVPDNSQEAPQYFVFAELVPGLGANGMMEAAFTAPRAGRNNTGNGTLVVDSLEAGEIRASDVAPFGSAAYLSTVALSDATADFITTLPGDPVYGGRVGVHTRYYVGLSGAGVTDGYYRVWRVDGNRLAIIAQFDPVDPDDPQDQQDPRIGAGPQGNIAYEVYQPCYPQPPDFLPCSDPQDGWLVASGTAGELADFNGFLAIPELPQDAAGDPRDFSELGVVSGDLVTYDVARSPQLRAAEAVHGDATLSQDMRTIELSASPLVDENQDFANPVSSWQIASPSGVRLETWVATCANAQCTEWKVYGTLSQPAPDEGAPDPGYELLTLSGNPLSGTYEVDGVPVVFTLTEGNVDFVLGDSISFTTTGVTASSAGVTIEEGQINEGPTAVISATPLSGIAPLEVEFDGRDSFDPNGMPLQYRWDFADGSAYAYGDQVTHLFLDSGTFTVILRVTNIGTGLFGETGVDIEMINNRPTAVITANPLSGPSQLWVHFNGGQSSDTETPADQLIYEWDFGDGEVAGTGVPGELSEVDHFYALDGEFVAMLTVEDGDGKTNSATVSLLVGNTIPVAVITYTELEGSDPHPVIFNAINSFDADGDSLSVTWHWGDGTPDKTFPATGSSGTDGAVEHKYELPAGSAGDSFDTSATVCDDHDPPACSAWSGVTVVVNPSGATNTRPSAFFTIDPNPPIVNEPFTVNATASFDLPLGDLIASYNWDFDFEGTHSFGTGVFTQHTYTEPGTYTIALTVADAEVEPNTNTKYETVVVVGDGGTVPPPTENRAPTAVLLANPLAGFAGVTEFNFDAQSSSDPDGDALTYSWSFGDGTFGSENQEFHIFDEPGNYLVRLTVRDSRNASTDATQSISVSLQSGNKAPVAIIATGPRTGSVPVTLTFDGRTSFDTDGDQLTYKWEFKLNGVSIDTATGATITRTFDLVGSYTVVLEVSDGLGGIGRSEPEIVEVTARVAAPAAGDIDPPSGQDVPGNSANQRPGRFCGFGMLLSMFGTLLGLSATMATRRRFRR